MRIINISGHQQPHGSENPNAEVWRAIASRVGDVHSLWAGPRAAVREPGFAVDQRPRGPFLLGTPWLLWALRSALRAARAARRCSDSSLLVGAEPWAWLIAYTASRATGVPWEMEVHGDFLQLPPSSFRRARRSFYELLTVRLGRRAAAVRSVSPSIQESLRQTGIESVLIPPRLTRAWSAQARQSRRPLAARPAVILTVGRLVPSKGVDLLLRAVDGMDDTRVRVVGDGPERGRLVALAETLGLGHRVAWLGDQPPERVRQEMAAADALVIASRDEGLPRTLLEGAASGLPVLATRVGGIPDAAGAWRSVIICDPTVASLREHLQQMLQRPPDQQALEDTRDRVLAEFGFDANVERLVAFYRAAAGDSVPSA